MDEGEIRTGKVEFKGSDGTKYVSKIAFDLNLASRTHFEDERLVASDTERLAHSLSEIFEKMERNKRMGR